MQDYHIEDQISLYHVISTKKNWHNEIIWVLGEKYKIMKTPDMIAPSDTATTSVLKLSPCLYAVRFTGREFLM